MSLEGEHESPNAPPIARAAKVILEAHKCGFDIARPLDDLAIALAAIAAIEEPSETMIEAGIEAHKKSMDAHSLLLRSIICDIWRAMHKALMEGK